MEEYENIVKKQTERMALHFRERGATEIEFIPHNGGGCTSGGLPMCLEYELYSGGKFVGRGDCELVHYDDGTLKNFMSQKEKVQEALRYYRDCLEDIDAEIKVKVEKMVVGGIRLSEQPLEI